MNWGEVKAWTWQKIETLGESAQYDLCNACGVGTRAQDDLGRWIYPAALPDGQRVRVLKVLMTNVCEKNCYYCGVRASRDVPRTSFTPEELARAFDRMHRADLVDGLFLSSGVCTGPEPTMDRMIACVELIRNQYAFCRLCPPEAAARRLGGPHRDGRCNWPTACRSTWRRPTPSDWLPSPPARTFRRAGRADAHRQAPDRRQRRPAGPGRPDHPVRRRRRRRAGPGDPVHHGAALYRELDLRRAYFSAFQPVPGTPLDGQAPTPAWREHRLYQADWLLRFYGFAFDDLVFDRERQPAAQGRSQDALRPGPPRAVPGGGQPRLARGAAARAGHGSRSVGRILSWRRQGTLRETGRPAKAGAVAPGRALRPARRQAPAPPTAPVGRMAN